MRTCGTAAHVEPWYNCPHCRATSGYRVSLAGMSVKPDDYLPPMNELDARRNEQAAAAGGNREVIQIGEPQ